MAMVVLSRPSAWPAALGALDSFTLCLCAFYSIVFGCFLCSVFAFIVFIYALSLLWFNQCIFFIGIYLCILFFFVYTYMPFLLCGYSCVYVVAFFSLASTFYLSVCLFILSSIHVPVNFTFHSCFNYCYNQPHHPICFFLLSPLSLMIWIHVFFTHYNWSRPIILSFF